MRNVLKNLTVVFAISVLAPHSVSSADTALQVRPQDPEVSQLDLQILAAALGVRTESFDYEASRPHCVHFWVESSVNNAVPDTIDARGACGESGPHRLTIQWRKKDDQVQLYFYLHHRDEKSLLGLGGPHFKIRDAAWEGGGGIQIPTDFNFNQRSKLTEYRYERSGSGDPAPSWARSIVVYVELRENPAGIIRTESPTISPNKSNHAVAHRCGVHS